MKIVDVIKKIFLLFVIMLSFAIVGCSGRDVAPVRSDEPMPANVYTISENAHLSTEELYQDIYPQYKEPYQRLIFHEGEYELIQNEESVSISSIPIDLAAQFFAELEALHASDNGYLWGVDLRVPFIFVDPQTRNMVANQPDNRGILTKQGDVYTGILPASVVPAYSFPSFGGELWAMLPWGYVNLDDKTYRLRTMSHMAFHVTQARLFGNRIEWNNVHMNETEARISILLEINALIAALASSGDERLTAVHDALSIRAERRRLLERGVDENRLEVWEGLADYTEYRLNLTDTAELIAELELAAHSLMHGELLEPTFGYLSGALYGLLLSETGMPWKYRVGFNTDLGALLKEFMGINELTPFDALDLYAHGYAEIRDYEAVRLENHKKMIQDIIYAFTNQPTLHIPRAESRAFIAQRMFALPEWGQVFSGRMETHGDFGRLILHDGDFINLYEEGALILASGIEIEGNRAFGHGWELELNSGFEIRHRDGNFEVVRANS